MLVPIAHAGHWLPYLLAPVIVLVAVVVGAVRERRRQASQARAEGPERSREGE